MFDAAHDPWQRPALHVRPITGSQSLVVKPLPSLLHTVPVVPLQLPLPGVHTTQPNPSAHTGVPPEHWATVETPLVHVVAVVPLHVTPFGAHPASVPVSVVASGIT